MSEREIAEIPEDIWIVAQELCHDVEDACVDLYEGADPKHNPAVLIARAILAERERCAAVAKAMLVYADTTSAADEAIPAAIMDPNHWLAKNPELATSIRQGSQT